MDGYEAERRKAWEELEVSPAELRSLSECLKKDEFRTLLREYAEEVSSPESRRQYEAEMVQLERERGVELTFVHPGPGHVIKTSLDGSRKCFVNVASSEHVDKPSSDSQPGGLRWSLPHLLAPPRDDLDNARSRCCVFDVIFHPDTLRLSAADQRFAALLNDTALDAVEKNFNVKLDRKNLKFPKMSYKGVSQPTVIRRPCKKTEPAEKLDIDPEIFQKIMTSYDENRERQSQKPQCKPTRPAPNTTFFKPRVDETEDANSKYTTPKFIVKYQTSVDMDQFLDSKEAKMHSAIPKNLVININLPLLKSAGDATLDVQERHLSLKSEKPAKYNLELPLSYRVDADKGSAKFDSKSKILIITLPVIRDACVLADPKEDSGVESDNETKFQNSFTTSRCSNNNVKENSSNSQESEDGSLICDLSDNVTSDCADTALRTCEDVETLLQFMNPNAKYSLPPFTCNVYDNVLAITIHAKNVDFESIEHRVLQDNAGFHVLLTSIGAGFFPVYYSLCLKIENNSILPDTLAVEPWDNNVVISVEIENAAKLSWYFIGLDENLMEPRDLSAASSIKNKLLALSEDAELETDKNVEVIRSRSEVIVNVQSHNDSAAHMQSSNLDSDDEDGHESEVQSQKEERRRKFEQSRSVSESSGDELTSSVGSGSGSSARYKSILKSRTSLFSRSISESSIDDYNVSLSLSSVTFNDPILELNSESEGSSLKKTVRFNDVVSRQLYRSNSSILGQRKKNQRKLRNKKRAQDRRKSESENSETDEREKYKVEIKTESERGSSDTIRPILNPMTNKQCTEGQKTANIEIARSTRSNKRKQKRNTEESENSQNERNKFETENASEADEPFEHKPDLLFDIEV